MQNAYDHWIKHYKEFPEYANAKQYIEGAHNFVKNPPKGTLKKIRQNGEQLFYDPAMNTFVVLGVDGAPKSMFRPIEGMNYSLRQ